MYRWLTGQRGPAHLVNLKTWRAGCGTATEYWSVKPAPAWYPPCEACHTNESNINPALIYQPGRSAQEGERAAQEGERAAQGEERIAELDARLTEVTR